MIDAARRGDEPGRGADAGHPADVADVAAVRRHDKRSATGERADQARREEEVRVHDVGPETAGRGTRRAREPEVLHLAAAAPVEDSTLDLVPAREELLLEPAHEDAEVGVDRARVHLGDEQDLHRSYTRWPRNPSLSPPGVA